VLDRKDLVLWGKAMIDLLQPFVRDPVLGLALADVKLAEPVLYAYLATWKMRGRMLDPAELGESHYREARALSRLYIEDIGKRRALLGQGAKSISR
jgi:hypothetical protein